MKRGSWGKMEADGLYGEYDRNLLPQISVRVRGQNVGEMRIHSLYTLAGNEPWSWKR